MAETDLKKLTKEELEKKVDSLRIFSGVFIFLIVALSFFKVRDIVQGAEIDWATITIIICTIGGFLFVYQELRAVKTELSQRK